jgi:hypothetical protein
MGDSATGSGPFGFLSRRRWLRLALTGGVVATGGGVGLLALRGSAPAVSGLQALSNHEYRTLRALADTHLPPGGAFPEGGSDHGLVRRLEAFVAREPPEVVSDLKRALVLFEYGPLLFGGRLATFSNLAPHDQLDEWRRWNASDRLLQRQVAFAFRKALGMFFFDQPEVWGHIGYPGPSFWGPAG